MYATKPNSILKNDSHFKIKYYGQNSFECSTMLQKAKLNYMLGYTLLYSKVLVVMQVHTAAIQSLQQQSDKVHCCHQEQRAHNHGSTGSTNSRSTAKNLRTLAAGHRLVVWIADVRCSIVTHHIGKDISWCGPGLLKRNSSEKRVNTSGAQ